MTTRIQITSLMSETGDPWLSAMASYLSRSLGLAVGYDRTLSETSRLAGLLDGSIQAGWVCGIVYVQKPDLELLAAPVMRGERYAGRPVYFSDLVVRRAGPYRTFADLQGARFARNEPGSFSGDLAVRSALLEHQTDPSFFGAWLDSGGHTRSIAMILAGTADAAAIDSMVLDQLAAANPAPREALRALKSLGPYPVPPWVSSRAVPPDMQSRLQAALLAVHRTQNGRRALASGQFERFTAVEDPAYDPIRRIAEAVATAPAPQSPNPDF